MYNGYKNYATWNLALWLGCDYNSQKGFEFLASVSESPVEDIAICLMQDCFQDKASYIKGFFEDCSHLGTHLEIMKMVDFLEVAENFVED